jgi:hypothetical protein
MKELSCPKITALPSIHAGQRTFSVWKSWERKKKEDAFFFAPKFPNFRTLLLTGRRERYFDCANFNPYVDPRTAYNDGDS